MATQITHQLIQTQRAWTATYEQLAAQPGRTDLRRRLIELHRVLVAQSPAVRAELRHRARQ